MPWKEKIPSTNFYSFAITFQVFVCRVPGESSMAADGNQEAKSDEAG